MRDIPWGRTMFLCFILSLLVEDSAKQILAYGVVGCFFLWFYFFFIDPLLSSLSTEEVKRPQEHIPFEQGINLLRLDGELVDPESNEFERVSQLLDKGTYEVDEETGHIYLTKNPSQNLYLLKCVEIEI